MKKIDKFTKDQNILPSIINKINAGLISGETIAGRIDFRFLAIINGALFKRFYAQLEHTIPANESSCQEADLKNKIKRTYELYGTKIQVEPNYQNYCVYQRFPEIPKKIYYEQYIKRIQKSD
ncbi:hypothetical protein [Flavobacterium sp. MDT1-60]|uniref:hypothetical protein n=1 Tax=Flavobacterium sp. MDT1-60 TaxID=1979344 RepID=UPI0017833F3B|nr:hypothetical protein [Flavobacterium sp. MDT1-60]QOG04397.1 hypothetical protein IHE43_09370 [Flavobacterium sp. MDT1-60]